MLKYAIYIGIFGSLKLLFRDGEKAALHTKVSLSFMDMAIFSNKFFNTDIVLNC